MEVCRGVPHPQASHVMGLCLRAGASPLPLWLHGVVSARMPTCSSDTSDSDLLPLQRRSTESRLSTQVGALEGRGPLQVGVFGAAGGAA